MRHFWTFLWTAICTTLIAILGTFVYHTFQLISAAVPRNSMSFERLAIDVMKLDVAAQWGVVVGVVLGIIFVGIGVFRVTDQGPSSDDGAVVDPDTLIKMRRAKLADEYLATRQDEPATDRAQL